MCCHEGNEVIKCTHIQTHRHRLTLTYTCRNVHTIYLLIRSHTQIHFDSKLYNWLSNTRLSTIRIIQFNVMVSVLPFLHIFCCCCCLFVRSLLLCFFGSKCEVVKYDKAANFPFFYRHFFFFLYLFIYLFALFLQYMKCMCVCVYSYQEIKCPFWMWFYFDSVVRNKRNGGWKWKQKKTFANVLSC